MSDKYILSIDPGLSSGVALLKYTDETAPELVQAWQFGGGAETLDYWVDTPRLPLRLVGSGVYGASGVLRYRSESLTTIAEKFNARNTGSFSYTTSSLEPLRCEGVLLAHSLPDTYVQPPQQYVFGGKDKADKKKRQHRFLKESGFYRTGKDLDAPDADDFRSACAHALAYMMRTGHKPTYNLVTEWIERNPV